MNKWILLLCVFWISGFSILHGQHKNLVSGPWAGNIELRNAAIWLEVSPEVQSVEIRFIKANDKKDAFKTVVYKGPLGNEFNPVKIAINGLEIDTKYMYEVVLDGQTIAAKNYTFTTKDLWQYRKPAPDFTFLTGSCAYFNQPEYDRPGRVYGGDSSIFKTMAGVPAAFTLWLGDSWYTREVDYFTAWGMNYRLALDRSRKILQPLMTAMPQYFIWDDHDFGPNDAGKEFIFKKESRELFKQYTLNPSYGYNEEGIYTKYSYSDVDFFMTDNRYFRSHSKYPDSLNGKPNPDKTYFGKEQMEWLKNQLAASRATFKIIASGSQVLNFATRYDCMCSYSYEFNELLQFIRDAKIEGVLFLTGDRHHSEVIHYDFPGLYTLFDVTVSPFTAGVGYVRGDEKANPQRVPGTLVEDRNFGKIQISGNKGERVLTIEYRGTFGEKLASWSIKETTLKFK